MVSMSWFYFVWCRDVVWKWNKSWVKLENIKNNHGVIVIFSQATWLHIKSRTFWKLLKQTRWIWRIYLDSNYTTVTYLYLGVYVLGYSWVWSHTRQHQEFSNVHSCSTMADMGWSSICWKIRHSHTCVVGGGVWVHILFWMCVAQVALSLTRFWMRTYHKISCITREILD